MGCLQFMVVYILHFHFDNEMRAFPLFIGEMKSVALNPKCAPKHQILCFRIYKTLPQFSNSLRLRSEEV